MRNFYDVIVVGGGAAGTMAAGTAAERGLSVLLLEKNTRLLRKVMITGKGRCNICNNCSEDNVIANVPSNGRFLYSALSGFSPLDTIDFFEDLGLEVKVERGNRVFPVSDNARDVVDTLARYVQKSGAEIKTATVESLMTDDNGVSGVKLSTGEEIKGSNVIVCCGGLSYPLTGSTGDGYKLAEQAGHTIVTPRPSLVPLVTYGNDCSAMQGLSLKNISVSLRDTKKNKVIYKDFGEMLFTHFGVSGPVILSASAHIRDMQPKRYELIIDLKPALSQEQLDKRIQRDFEKNINKDFANSLSELLPRKMIPIIIKRSAIPPETKCNSVTREQRMKLVSELKEFKLTVKEFRPVEEAIITSGGVSVKEINPKTMESKLCSGLYFAGEVIDTDAYTGGFNLQIAFSTGHLAGMSVCGEQ